MYESRTQKPLPRRHFVRRSDAFLNASMLLGGMGPVDPPRTEEGKLYTGLVFLIAIGIIAAPAFHRLMHLFHWKEDGR